MTIRSVVLATALAIGVQAQAVSAESERYSRPVKAASIQPLDFRVPSTTAQGRFLLTQDAGSGKSKKSASTKKDGGSGGGGGKKTSPEVKKDGGSGGGGGKKTSPSAKKDGGGGTGGGKK